jgi:undecaprenyl diphosphate synthase
MPPAPLDPQLVLGIPREKMPRHIAIIMDGNGRWARERGWPRIRGHEEGAKVVRQIVTQCARLGLEALTLYSFSTENWKRPREEVEFLMQLYSLYLVQERPTILENNVRLVHVGSREGLSPDVLAEMDETVRLSSANDGLRLCLALNYSSRAEMVTAVRSMLDDAAAGRIRPEAVDEALISSRLYTASLPDPDLLIRTANQHRVSNFLLWQISYAEMHVCEARWPEFTLHHLHAAIKDFASRERRYGGLGMN